MKVELILQIIFSEQEKIRVFKRDFNIKITILFLKKKKEIFLKERIKEEKIKKRKKGIKKYEKTNWKKKIYRRN